MSSTAKTVAIFTKSKFWVFDTKRVSLLMRGVCDKRSPYKFAAGAASLDLQRPPTEKFATSSFSCVALSDEYLAISAKDKVMVFATRGVHAGRLLVSDHIPKAGITKLCFSHDGTQLVGLVVVDDRISYEEARIYSTDTFGPRPNVDRPDILNTNDISLSKVTWDRDFVHSPSGLAFSEYGNMVAICTTHSKAQAQIRILKREVATWRNWGIKEVTVHTADHREWHGLALTGISLYSTLRRSLTLVFKTINAWLWLWTVPIPMQPIVIILFLKGLTFDWNDLNRLPLDPAGPPILPFPYPNVTMRSHC